MASWNNQQTLEYIHCQFYGKTQQALWGHYSIGRWKVQRILRIAYVTLEDSIAPHSRNLALKSKAISLKFNITQTSSSCHQTDLYKFVNLEMCSRDCPNIRRCKSEPQESEQRNYFCANMRDTIQWYNTDWSFLRTSTVRSCEFRTKARKKRW
jgi:hypothetical protein